MRLKLKAKQKNLEKGSTFAFRKIRILPKKTRALHNAEWILRPRMTHPM
jgi:hypothetical protein